MFMRYPLLRLVSFFLVLSFVLVVFSEAIRDKTSFFADYYDIPKNSVDVIIVGSSHVYSGYIPAVLWKEYGISSYNIFAWSMPMWTAYYYTKEALKTQSPQVVLFDISSLWYGYGEDPHQIDNIDFVNNQGIGFGINRYEYLLSNLSVGTTSRTLGEINDISRYHNGWRYNYKTTPPKKTDYSFLRNYGGLYTQLDSELLNMTFYQDVLEPRPDVKQYLSKLVTLSKENGFDLVFILTPCDMTKESAFIVNWTNEYCLEHNIPFLNFLDSTKYDFDLMRDMADVDHLNSKGAFKATRYAGDYLCANYSFRPPKTNPDYEQISKDAAAVYEMFDLNDNVIHASSSATALDWIRNSNSLDVIVFVQNSSLLSDVQKDFLKDMGIPMYEYPFVAEVNKGICRYTKKLNSATEIDVPDLSLKAELQQDALCLKLDDLEINRSHAPMSVFLYDYAMNRSTVIINIDENDFEVHEIVQLLRGT